MWHRALESQDKVAGQAARFEIVGSDIRPAILLARDEHDRLRALVCKALKSTPAIAAFLQSELQRAAVVEPSELPRSVVSIGSVVDYRYEQYRSVQRLMLVYPECHDIDAGRVSVLTSIGTALLGLSVGQSIEYTARHGCSIKLTVLKVHRRAA